MKISKKERTQKEIIDAAKRIIHDKGHDAITVRYLADITGYSYTNLYYYFKDLSSLLWKLRMDMIEDMITELTTICFVKDDPVEEIIEVFLNYVDYFYRHPNVFRFFYFYPFIKPDGDDSYQAMDQKFQGMWHASFYRLVHVGILETKDIEIVAKTIIYAIQGMIMLSFSANGTANQASIKEELVKLIHYLMRKHGRDC